VLAVVYADIQAPLSETQQTSNRCVLCACTSGPVCLDATLDRSAYCCGEFVRLRCEVVNGTDQAVTLTCRLVQVNQSITVPAFVSRHAALLDRDRRFRASHLSLADSDMVLGFRFCQLIAIENENLYSP